MPTPCHRRVHVLDDDTADYDAAEPSWDTDATAGYECGDCCAAVTADQATALQRLLAEGIDHAAATYGLANYL